MTTQNSPGKPMIALSAEDWEVVIHALREANRHGNYSAAEQVADEIAGQLR